eukprot:8393948-Ditylum_brightwellii.AAC.1
MGEFQQLHDRNTFKPLLAKALTTQEKKDALKAIMKQRETIPKEDAALPTVALELVILTSIIDAKENRDVTTTDIPGAYLSANMDDFVIMVLEGELAKLLVKTAPNI